MPSRSPSPPPPSRRGLGGDVDKPSMARLSLRHLRASSPGRTSASSRPAPSPAPSPPINHPFRFPTSAQPSYASKYQEQSCSDSESEIELDSPPRLTILKIQREEPGIPTSPPSVPPSPPSPIDLEPSIPTSPPSAPPSIDLEPGIPTSPPGGPPPSSTFDLESAMLPTFRSDTEEWHSTVGEDDSYFKSMVDNFVIAAKDVCKPSEDYVYKKGLGQQQTDGYAESALKYYNNDESNKVKYKLISAITSCGILDIERCYGHVNFIAKGNQQNSKEELFFAELRLDTYVPTCVVSLEGVKKVGGLRDSKYDKFHGVGIHIDAQHCYACRSGVMHPKNGLLYETGHVACSGFYHL